MLPHKIKLLLPLLIININLWAQLNPINNLNYQQTYNYGNFNCPSFNCFSLNWTLPNNSNDTLKGYNVYRNDVFMLFTTNTDVSCNGITPCLYNDFYNYIPFWLKVKAVYNADSLESPAVDSALVNDIAIHISELYESTFRIITNPVKSGGIISIMLPANKTLRCIKIISVHGKTIANYKLICKTSPVNISSFGLRKGLYFIILETDKEVFTQKLLVID